MNIELVEWRDLLLTSSSTRSDWSRNQSLTSKLIWSLIRRRNRTSIVLIYSDVLSKDQPTTSIDRNVDLFTCRVSCLCQFHQEEEKKTWPNDWTLSVIRRSFIEQSCSNSFSSFHSFVLPVCIRKRNSKKRFDFLCVVELNGCQLIGPLIGEFYSYENGLETHSSFKENGDIERRFYRRESGAGAIRKDSGLLLVNEDIGLCFQFQIKQNYYQMIYQDK